jgi:hypothetical protein
VLSSPARHKGGVLLIGDISADRARMAARLAATQVEAAPLWNALGLDMLGAMLLPPPARPRSPG